MQLRTLFFEAFYRSRGLRALAAMREFEGRERWQPARLEEHCQLRLQAILEHAASVPYYRGRGCGTSIESFSVLSKTDIQDQSPALTARDADARGSWLCGTSGSSGHRVYLLVDQAERVSRLGSSLRGDHWGGFAPGVRQVKLWGVPTGNPVRNAFALAARTLLLGQTSFPALQLDDLRVRRIHAYIRAARPRIISGFTSTLSAFALRSTELGLGRLSADKLIVTAENLDPASTEQIQGIFDGSIMQRYGCREAGDIAHQCEAGSWHLNCDHLYTEVLREDGSVGREGSGSLLITKLSNRLMPIVRYEVGDWVTLAPLEQRCPCGRSLPLMSELSGRTTTMLRLPSGRLASGHLGSLVAWHKPLRQWQIERLAAGQAVFRYVPLEGFSGEHLAAMESDLKRLFHGELEWTIQRCERIPAAPGGKHMPVLSAVD